MALGADDLQAGRVLLQVFAHDQASGQLVVEREAGFDDLAIDAHDFGGELDIGAASGHIGCDGHRADLTRVGDDLGLAVVVAGVKQLVFDAATGQHAAQQLGYFDRDRAYQYRQAELMQPVYLFDEGVVFFAFGAVDLVLLVKAANGSVGGDDRDVELVDLPQFAGFGFGGAGHTGQFVIHAEEILQGDGGDRLGLVLQLDSLLGLQCLVQTVGEAPPRLWSAGGLVDDNYPPVFGDEVLHVLFEEGIGFHQLVDIVHRLALFCIFAVRRFLLECLLLVAQVFVGADHFDIDADIGQHEESLLVGREQIAALFGQVDGIAAFIDDEVESLVDFLEVLVAHVIGFDAIDQLFNTLLLQHFGKAPVGGCATGGSEQPYAGVVVVFLAFLARHLGFGNDLVD